jgi:hypothetical protein
MPILKSLTFTNLPVRSHDPVANRRAKLVSRLEEQRQLLQDPSYAASASDGPARATSDARSRRSSPCGPGGARTRPAGS